ncbi:MAG TPA: ABC transporter permease [Steroidobacteraceae bacterium]|nr:ABC transporter permease [Steroidobacteraceae bacterium]
MASALRNVARNRLYFYTNVIGLAVAITAALLIGLFVHDELTYERFIPNSANVYIVTTVVTPPEGHGPLEALPSEPDVASWLKLDLPAVAQVARMVSAHLEVRRGDFISTQTVYWADPALFSILHLPVYAGTLKTALARPDGLVLTRSMARKYFGRDDPVGETLELGHAERATVTAVLEDLPSNTHLDVSMIASGSSQASAITSLDRTSMPAFGVKPWDSYTYVTLRPGASLQNVEAQLPDLLDRHAPSGTSSRTSSVYHLHLRPIGAIHLGAEARGTMKPSGRRETVYSLAAVGVLILVLAAVNFINLMTSRANRRAVEVGVRKVAGANQYDLIAQFIGESLIYVGCAAVVAISLAELSLPSLNAFLQRTMEFAYWSDPTLAAVAVTFLTGLALIAGIYPALLLSTLRPARVFGNSGIVSPQHPASVRRALVTVQVAILIGLVLAAVVISRQAAFAMNRSLRLDTNQVLVIRHACKGSFKDAVKALPGIDAVACSGWTPPESMEAASGASSPEGHQAVVTYTSIDFGFLELYGLKPLAGRFHDMNRGSDTLVMDTPAGIHEPVVLNEAAVHALGYRSPIAAVGRTISWSHALPPPAMSTGPHQSEIIGVVPDFLTGSIREPIRPAVFYVDPSRNSVMSVKLGRHAGEHTLTSINQLWAQMDHQGPIARSFIDQLLQGKYNEFVRQASLLAMFSAVAIFIACIGLFALSAFTAERRRKEIGLRKALGARRRDITWLLLWDFAQPILWANAIAWPAGFLLMNRWLHGFAYHTDLQLWIFLFAGGLATGISLLTVVIHTVLIAGQQPVLALRYE